MKTISRIAFCMLVVALVIASCKPKGEKAAVSEAKEVTSSATAGKSAAVNTAASFINWTGTKVGGQHTGELKLSSGSLNVENNTITGGEFVIDINSINNTDQEGEGKANLEGHLKAPDFFDAAKFPTGKFVITNVAAQSGKPQVTHMITGNLTLKGITKSVAIPANVIVANGQVSAVTPAFTINRTDFGINYASGIIGTAKDKLINDNIGLVINLKASI